LKITLLKFSNKIHYNLKDMTLSKWYGKYKIVIIGSLFLLDISKFKLFLLNISLIYIYTHLYSYVCVTVELNINLQYSCMVHRVLMYANYCSWDWLLCKRVWAYRFFLSASQYYWLHPYINKEKTKIFSLTTSSFSTTLFEKKKKQEPRSKNLLKVHLKCILCVLKNLRCEKNIIK